MKRNVIQEKMEVFEIAIYGSTSGAVAAAIQAARLGRKTVLISPEEHIGLKQTYPKARENHSDGSCRRHSGRRAWINRY